MAKVNGRSPEPLEPLLTCREVAAVLKVTEAALAQLRWKGIGPSYVKFGRSVRYRQTDIAAYIERSIVRGD